MIEGVNIIDLKQIGNGIEKKLLKHLLSFKLRVVRVKTHLNNTGALRFYLRNGFVKYGIIKVGLSKFINSVMYDGKRYTAEKIIYSAFDAIKAKTKEDPIKVFNDAVSNVRPNLEVISRRIGGATYQVPVEVKAKRSQALAFRWLLNASRKRKNKTMSEKVSYELIDASQRKGAAIKKREDVHRMAESNKAFAHFRW